MFQDEKFLLKFHSGAGSVAPATGREEARRIHAPVIKFSNLLARPNATNKRAFYVINTTHSEPQLNELVTSSSSEARTWMAHINEVTAAFKSRDSKFRATTSMTNMSSFSNGSRGAFESPTEDKSKTTNRSQSFNENLMGRKDSIQFRPLPSPPPLDIEVIPLCILSFSFGGLWRTKNC